MDWNENQYQLLITLTHPVSLLVGPLPRPPLDVLESHHGGLLQLLEALGVGQVLSQGAVAGAANHPHASFRVRAHLGTEADKA